MRANGILIAVMGLVLAGPALAQTGCAVGQPCPNGPKLPFPVINPAQGINSLAKRLLGPDDQTPKPAQPLPWNYVPVATPPPSLPPDLQR